MLYRYLVLLLVFSFSAVTSNSTLYSYPNSKKQSQGRRSSEEMMLLSIVNNEPDSDVPSLPVEEGCSKCAAREDVKNYTLRHIQEDIMSKLGFTHPPNITGRNLNITPPFYDLINSHGRSPYHDLHHTLVSHGPAMQSDQPSFPNSVFISEEEEEYNFLTERVLIISDPYPRLRHHPRGPQVLQFKFSPKTLQHKVQGAILWVYLKSTGTNYNVPVTIEVRKVTRPLNSNTDKPHLTVITTHKEIRRNGTEGQWVLIDVTRLVAEWFRNSKDNYGIVIETNPSSEHGAIVTLANNSSNQLVPFLEVQTKDTKKLRNRRTTGLTCNDESNEIRCCKYPLKVDFEEFGWDWIIAPKFYEANYCLGECNHMFLPNYPHTTLVRYTNTSVTGPCCAPRSLSPISMLYFDNDLNIIYGKLPNMVVDRCGCV